MPGPVSDSYDPEFGTSANAQDVRDAMYGVTERILVHLGPELKNIVGVAQGPAGEWHTLKLSERELRIIRFGLNRALESI